MYFIKVNIDGSMSDNSEKMTDKTIKKKLQKIANNKGEGNISELYNWKYNNNIIKCYGWYDGEAGYENKHELVPSGASSFLDKNSDEILLYGELFLLIFDNNNNMLDFKVPDYALFYDFIVDGFDECISEDDEDDMEYDSSDDNFISDDHEEETDDDYDEYSSDNSLDNNLNEDESIY